MEKNRLFLFALALLILPPSRISQASCHDMIAGESDEENERETPEWLIELVQEGFQTSANERRLTIPLQWRRDVALVSSFSLIRLKQWNG